MNNRSNIFTYILVGCLLLVCFVWSISVGSVAIPFSDVINILLGNTHHSDTWELIVLEYRLPKAITCMLIGSGLALAGLLTQTLFRNPLAGPFVLGVSSGSSLMVALTIMGAGLWGFHFNSFNLFLSATAGAFLVLLFILLVARYSRDISHLLIVGVMFSSFTSAIISVLSFFASSENLQRYIFWTLGDISHLETSDLLMLSVITFGCISASLLLIKRLNALLIGETHAQLLGISLSATRYIILLIISLLSAVSVSLVGPIAFVGFATPHLVRHLFQNINHQILIPMSCLIGAILLLVCNVLSHSLQNDIVIPINIITSFFGAPLVIWLILRKKKFIF